jgi:hypothetical protein
VAYGVTRRAIYDHLVSRGRGEGYGELTGY